MDVLTLSLEKRNGRIRIKLLDAAGGVIEKDQSQSVTQAELDEIRKLISTEKDLKTEIPALGRKLGSWLLPPKVREAWEKQAAPFRTRLEVAPDLADIAWELASSKERLFLDSKLPFFRKAIGLAASAVAPWPLDVLVILGSNEQDLRSIGGYKEESTIRGAFRPRNRTVDLHILHQPDRDTIKSQIAGIRPHVLHFIGHGSEKGLELSSSQGYVTWTDQAIRTDLNGAAFTPPLVYLNACRSTGREELDQNAFEALKPGQFAPLAQAFLDKGSRAVLAMQADIDGDSAAECAKAFYTSLLNGSPVDAAVASARAAVDRLGQINEAGIREKRDAYLPVLLVSGSPDDVLPGLTDLCAVPAQAAIDDDSDLPRIVRELVNHDQCRRAALRAPVLDAPARNLLVIHGAAETGKSWLLGWCIDGWLRRQRAVRYVPMSAHKQWLDVLAAILNGQKSLGALAAPLPTARDIFETAITAAPSKVGKRKWPPQGKLDLQETLATFNSALRAETGQGELLLVLDQFSSPGVKLNSVVFSALWSNWIENLVVNGDGRVRVIMGLSKDDMDRYKFKIPPDAGIGLEPISAEHYSDLLKELVLARHSADYQRLQPQYQEFLPKWTPRAVTPKDLAKDCDILHEFAIRAKRD